MREITASRDYGKTGPWFITHVHCAGEWELLDMAVFKADLQRWILSTMQSWSVRVGLPRLRFGAGLLNFP